MDLSSGKMSNHAPTKHKLRVCVQCGLKSGCDAFSRTQWKKESTARCKACVEAGAAPSKERSDAAAHSSNQNDGIGHGDEVLTALVLEPRPQRAVPGLEGLTVCTDWPQTRNGKPPNAQSLIYNPLLACVFGPMEGYCMQEQIEIALIWWTLALPSWPRWTEQLRLTPGVLEFRDRLRSTAKGQPNALIPKTRGRGKVPHFTGKLQVEILEMVPTVALEVYACVACLYSTAAYERQIAFEN